MKKFNTGDDVRIIGAEFGDKAETEVGEIATIIGFTKIGEVGESGVAYHVEVTDSEGDDAKVREGIYREDSLSALET